MTTKEFKEAYGPKYDAILRSEEFQAALALAKEQRPYPPTQTPMDVKEFGGFMFAANAGWEKCIDFLQGLTKEQQPKKNLKTYTE